MAKKWDGSKVIKEIDEALDRAQAQFLTNTRSKLSAASPVKTGRLASGWNIGVISLISAPRRARGPGPNQAEAYDGQITYGGNWFISGNLPAAGHMTLGGRRGGGDWFPGVGTTSARMLIASFSGN